MSLSLGTTRTDHETDTYTIFLIILSGCSRYDAEVGYYKDGEERFDVWGNFSSLDECKDAAIYRYHSYNYNKEGSAFSWACLKKNRSGGYEKRLR